MLTIFVGFKRLYSINKVFPTLYVVGGVTVECSVPAGVPGGEGSSTHHHHQVAVVAVDQLLSPHLDVVLERHVLLRGQF